MNVSVFISRNICRFMLHVVSVMLLTYPLTHTCVGRAMEIGKC